MTEIDRYYQILEVIPDATSEDINQSYQDLTWIWQPDRFVGNPRLQKMARGKLQEINNAHYQLTARLTVAPSPYPKAYYPDYLPHYGTAAYSSPRSQDRHGSFEAVTKEYRGAKQTNQREVSTWLD